MQKKFSVKIGSVDSFYASIEDLKVGDNVIVDNGGHFLGVVTGESKSDGSELPLVLRLASEADIKKNNENKPKAKETLTKAKEICKKHNKDMKILSAQYSLGCEKLVLTFSSENRVDFRDLVKELATAFRARIELKQVGLRDEARIIGGLGPCGMPCCCNRHLREVPFTGIKMAKNQNLSLSPQKINGLCGKIMCCVSYENEHYANTLKDMPRPNSRVKTPDGMGTVASSDCLRCRVCVRVPKDGGATELKNYPLSDVKFEKQVKHFDSDDND